MVPRTFWNVPLVGGDIQDAFVGFQMLVLEVEDNMPASDSLRSVIVVLDMIGPQAHAGIIDVHILIGDEQIALLLLRAAGRNIRHAARMQLASELAERNRE